MGLLTTLGLAALVLPCCYLYTVSVVATRFPTLRNKRICVLVAHPDDEAMFFAPTMLALTRPETGNHVKILCLSSGTPLRPLTLLPDLLASRLGHATTLLFYFIFFLPGGSPQENKPASISSSETIGRADRQLQRLTVVSGLGDAEGLGETRKKELAKSGMTLGLRKEEDVFVVDSP